MGFFNTKLSSSSNYSIDLIMLIQFQLGCGEPYIVLCVTRIIRIERLDLPNCNTTTGTTSEPPNLKHLDCPLLVGCR